MEYIKGYGISLKDDYFEDLLNEQPNTIDFLEIMVDNYLNTDNISFYYLDQLKELYSISFHGIGMSLGSVSGLDYDYLNKVKKLLNLIKPKQYSEHLCFTHYKDFHSNDLLPMPYTEEAITVFSKNIKDASEFLEFPIMIENLSSYIEYDESEMSEWEYLDQVTSRSNSNILLDINNIYVNSFNHNFHPMTFIESINPNKVKEIHLAGYEKEQGYLLDSHGAPIHDVVWDLFRKSRHLFPNASVVVEWDNNVPTLSTILSEIDKVIELDKELL